MEQWWDETMAKYIEDQENPDVALSSSCWRHRGQLTDVYALVSSSICDEVLFSWQTLKKLGVIPEEFPLFSVKAAAVTMLPNSTTEDKGETERVHAVNGSGKDAREAQDAITQMIVEFGTVFNQEG